jgi:LEA14-like dessication related protein
MLRILRMPLRTGAIALLALLAAFGCAMRDAPALDVGLQSVSLVDVQPLEQRFQLGLRFTNRTDRDIAVDGLTYRLDINGREFANGVSNQPFTVPRFGEARIEAAATSSLSGVLAQLEELRKRLAAPAGTVPAVTYRLTGRANTGIMGTQFDVQSELPFPSATR